MRIVLQRVSHARVLVDGEVVGQTKPHYPGLLLLVGAAHGDELKDARALATKVANLRIFPDTDGKMNRSIVDVEGGVLLVSQFTLLGDCRKGRRPSFVGAMDPTLAEPLLQQMTEALRQEVEWVQTGVFGADMQVELVNDGPVTMLLDSAKQF